MRKKLTWNVAAVAVIELAMMTTVGYPQIGSAKRAQAPQIDRRDVVLDATRRGDRPVARTDDRARKALASSSFKVGLQSVRFGEAKAGNVCPPWMCNSPLVAGAAILGRAHVDMNHERAESLIIERKSAKPLGISVNTAFDWLFDKIIQSMLEFYKDKRLGEAMVGPVTCPKWISAQRELSGPTD